ncbi:threonyl-tRNA synthetase [Thecaphora frezii]
MLTYQQQAARRALTTALHPPKPPLGASPPSPANRLRRASPRRASPLFSTLRPLIVSVASLRPTPLPRSYPRSLATAAVPAQSSAAAAAPNDVQEFTLELNDNDYGTAVAEVLKQRLPANHPKTFLARLQDGTLLALRDTVPAGSQTLQPLTFDSTDPAARHAFWLSSAYLLAIALKEVLGDRVVLAASPTLNASGAGGAGFAYEYLLAPSAEAAAALSPTSSTSAAAATQSIFALIEGSQQKPGLSDADRKKIEKAMEKLASRNLALRRESVSFDDARRLFAANPFKAERVEAIAAKHGQEAQVPVVRVGDGFVDLLPSLDADAAGDLLIPDSKPIKAVQLSEWSAATWTPSDPASSVVPPSTQALTRVRAVSFPTSAQLKAHLAAQLAALAADHRTIGKAQSLFLTHESSPGTPFILPHGMRLARKVERVVRDLYDVYGYDEVQSPQLYRSWLWKKSGHWDNYRDDMFASEGYKERSERRSALFSRGAEASSEVSSIEGRSSCCSIHEGAAGRQPRDAEADEDEASFGLKPMNCPGHCLIFGSQERSYRDLPMRFAEFSPLHRNEASGSLSGLTRVRRFHQDDAHVFCRPEQVSDEIEKMLTMLSSAYTTFGFRQFELVLSTRPAHFLGEMEEWDAAEAGLKAALERSGREWRLNEADGAFYGPKIDIRLVDGAGRKHQTATIQLDFQLPQRFNLQYTDAEGQKRRPVMIHRAILGSVERFMAILMEQTRGWWPFWLSPRQAIVLPTSARDPELVAYAETVRKVLALGYDPDAVATTIAGEDKGPGSVERRERTLQRFYVDRDDSNDKLAKMVRSAQLARYNFILIVGKDEMEKGTVSVRVRDDSNAPAGLRVDGEEVRQGTYEVHELRRLFCRLDSVQAW